MLSFAISLFVLYSSLFHAIVSYLCYGYSLIQ